jgi:RNA polymerase sigma-70 factor (ECF subfamily)
LLGRADEVDDLVQDVFLDAIRGLRSLREPGALRAWLATVTVRHARRRLRRRSLLSMLGLDRGTDVEGLVAEGEPKEMRARVMAIYAALDRVPADARIAWILFTVEGHSLEEVGALGGYSRATAHRRIQAAQAAVDEALRGG